jgi:hypothetical protein
MGLFSHHFQQASSYFDPAGAAIGRNDPILKPLVKWAQKPGGPPAPPGVPNPNDASNAAQSETDALRMRRGLLGNIYAGAQNQQPVSGKTLLGT